MGTAWTAGFHDTLAIEQQTLERAAVALVERLVTDPTDTPSAMVVVTHPTAYARRVVAPSAIATVRAAVSVAVAADNRRLWNDVGSGDVDRPVASLPEVVRAAAEADGFTSVHIAGITAGIEPDTELACAVLWFVGDRHPAPTDLERDETLAFLRAAHEREVARSAAITETVTEDTEPASPTRIEERLAASDRDDLTGFANRDHFTSALEEFDGSAASLVIIDLDEFATINAEHGRDVGDLVLQAVADRMRATVRRDDLIARLGGDEFAVLLSGADRGTAITVARRLLEVIGQPFDGDLSAVSVTASIGLAHEMGLVDMDELFESAENAMASSKRHGRARVVIAY